MIGECIGELAKYCVIGNNWNQYIRMRTTTCVQQSYIITLWIQRPSVCISPVTQHLPFHIMASACLVVLRLLQSEIESLQGIFLSSDNVFFSIHHLASPQYMI